MMPRVAVILINYKDYAKKFLPDCIESLRKQSYPCGSFKVFIIDNETSQETVEYLNKIAPEAEVIPNQKNDGFAEGNNIAMRRAIDLNYDYIVLLNMDTVVDPKWLEELVKVAEMRRSKREEKGCVEFCNRISQKNANGFKPIGAVQSLIMLYPKIDEINSLGNQLHFLGFGFCEGYGKKKLQIKNQTSKLFFYASGAAVLYPVEVLKRVGLFDPEFFMYHEDTDLSWRIRQAGYDVVLAPKSIIYHKYQFSRSILQFYYMERNRLIMLFENWRFGTLLLILPPFFVMELGQLGYAALRGLFWAKLRVYRYFLQPENWIRMIENKRKKAKLRKVKDRELAKLVVGKIEFQEISNPILKYLVNPVFNVYWKVVRNLIFW